MNMESTLERQPIGPEGDQWPELLDRGFRGLLADLVSLARRAIDSLADELLRQPEADRQTIDAESPKPAIAQQAAAPPKPVKQCKPRTPKPERLLTVRPRECRLYVGKIPRGLSRVEREVVGVLDHFGYMNRTELQRDTGCCYLAVTRAAIALCQRGIAECDDAYRTNFRLIDPVPAGVQCEADD
jgi:hypothetical protein